MKHTGLVWLLAAGLSCGAYAQNQATPQNQAPQPQTAPEPPKQSRSAAGEIGSGTGDAAKGAAKGTGAAAEGVGKGAGDLVTLHPLDATGNVVKGGAEAGKDVTVGAAKGTGKVVKGTGKILKKPF